MVAGGDWENARYDIRAGLSSFTMRIIIIIMGMTVSGTRGDSSFFVFFVAWLCRNGVWSLSV